MFWNVLQKYQLRQICLAELWHAAWSWGFQACAEPHCVECLGIGSSRVQHPCWTKGKLTSQERFYLDINFMVLFRGPRSAEILYWSWHLSLLSHVCGGPEFIKQGKQHHRIPQGLALMYPTAWRVEWSWQWQFHLVIEPWNSLGWEWF